jgi:CBS domain-containing protein
MFHVHGILGHVFSGTLDAGGRVVGFVSRTDLLRALATEFAYVYLPLGGAPPHSMRRTP